MSEHPDAGHIANVGNLFIGPKANDRAGRAVSAPAYITVAQAVWPHDLPAAEMLLRRYRIFLETNLAAFLKTSASTYEHELGSLSKRYNSIHATLLLAWHDGRPLGCAAVALFPERRNAAEIKRLFVMPEARGLGVGRALIQAAIDWSREHGVTELLLDTVPEAMPAAVALYRSLGFVETEPYGDGPLLGFAYFQLRML